MLPFVLSFQVTDQNKRKVLGDLIYLIRFPLMDADEFVRSLSNTQVLTAEESDSLIMLMKGSPLETELGFSSVERSSPWTEEFFKGLSIVPQHGPLSEDQVNPPGHLTGPTLLNTSIPFQINYGRSQIIYIKSVFLINDTNYELSNVRLLESEGKISRLENRTYVGCQLYEAAFNPRVLMQSSTTASISVQQQFPCRQPPLCEDTSCQSTLLQGQRTIGANLAPYKRVGKAQAGGLTFHKNPNTDTTITIENVPWHFVVGFKYKTR